MYLKILIPFMVLVSCAKPEKEKFECSLISPDPFFVISNGIPFSLDVRASHMVLRVEVYFDDVLIINMLGNPRLLSWTPQGIAGGNHSITVKLYPYEFEPATITVPVILQYLPGEKTQGGTIFYLDETKIHGLSVGQDMYFNSKRDLPWGTADFVGATDTTDGKSNTSLLANSGVLNEYFWNQFKYETDWYVPSKSEMLLLLDYVNTSGDDLNMRNTYWTSTECCRANACAVDFVNHKTLVTLKEDSLFRVRLIRRF